MCRCVWLLVCFCGEGMLFRYLTGFGELLIIGLTMFDSDCGISLMLLHLLTLDRKDLHRWISLPSFLFPLHTRIERHFTEIRIFASRTALRL
uniref:Putative secreted peptide n=1 Tax=Anopheles braziliensis TaxID=58242 RepID=A0A2M3ZNS2_9DIPT